MTATATQPALRATLERLVNEGWKLEPPANVGEEILQVDLTAYRKCPCSRCGLRRQQVIPGTFAGRYALALVCRFCGFMGRA